MNVRNTLIILGATAVAVPLLKSLYDWAQTPSHAPSHLGNSPKVIKMVEKTLHQHEGEDSPFVHAFEEALEEETHHEQELAHAGGLRA